MPHFFSPENGVLRSRCTDLIVEYVVQVRFTEFSLPGCSLIHILHERFFFFFLNHYANLSFSSPQRLLLFYVFSAIDKAAIVSFVWVVVAFVAFQSIDCQQVTYEEMHAHTHTHTHTLTHTHRHTQTQAPWGSPVAIGQRRAMTSRRVGDVSRQTSSKATTRFQKINK